MLSFSSQIIKCCTLIKTKGTAGLFNINDKYFTFSSFIDLNQYKIAIKTSNSINFKNILLHINNLIRKGYEVILLYCSEKVLIFTKALYLRIKFRNVRFFIIT